MEKIRRKMTIDSNKVAFIVKYLDNNFDKDIVNKIDVDGRRRSIPIVRVKEGLSAEIEQFRLRDLPFILESVFGKYFKNKTYMKKLLRQILIDWYLGKITKTGMLTKNHF